MNRLLYLLGIFIFFGCKKENQSLDSKLSNGELEREEIVISVNPTPEKTEKVFNDLMLEIEELEDVEPEKEEECIFDQDTQTDGFLKGIKEFEGYDWNQKTKSAKIFLDEKWGLIIKRGGCNHFELSVTFIHKGILDFEKNKELIFQKLIWATSLLDEFDTKLLEKLIKENKLHITKEDEFNYFGNFMDVETYESYFFNFKNQKHTKFTISYHLS